MTKTPERLIEKAEAEEQARIDKLADTLAADNTLVAELTGFLVEQFKRRPKPWSAMKEHEQRSLINAGEYAAKAFVRRIVQGIATAGVEGVKAQLESYKDAG